MMLTKEMVALLAKELVEVRNNNEVEGSDYFQAMMTMIQDDDRYDADFNEVIRQANNIEGEL